MSSAKIFKTQKYIHPRMEISAFMWGVGYGRMELLSWSNDRLRLMCRADFCTFAKPAPDLWLRVSAESNPLFRFEVAPGKIAGVTDVPETVYLGWQIGCSNIYVGEIDAIDRQAGEIPGVDVATQIA
jgi:hypothetical protein